MSFTKDFIETLQSSIFYVNNKTKRIKERRKFEFFYLQRLHRLLRKQELL